MKFTIVLILCTFLSIGINAQSFNGAWEGYHTSENGENLKSVVLFAGAYQVIATYESETGKFISTNGGPWRLSGNTMTEKVEFDSHYPERIGTEVSFEVFLNDSTMGIVGSDIKYKRIDDGLPGKLQGAWFMSGRKKDGEIQLRDDSEPIQTMKLLSGTHFQWIDYNVETMHIIGTGGGTYTTTNGEYTENIAFFSKDDARVGASLKFNYSLIDGNWHHSGLSSKGDPIYELWSVWK